MDRKYISFLPCNPCMREGPSFGAMTATRSFWPQLSLRGGGSGIAISSFFLTTPACGPPCFSSPWLLGLEEAYRTRLCGRPRPCLRGLACSPKPLSCLGARGSSSTASWSTRSPVSLQNENSDPASSYSSSRLADERRSRCRSSSFSSKSSLSSLSGPRREEEERVCSGMLAGLRVLLLPPKGCENGILAGAMCGGGLSCAAALLLSANC